MYRYCWHFYETAGQGSWTWAGQLVRAGIEGPLGELGGGDVGVRVCRDVGVHGCEWVSVCVCGSVALWPWDCMGM